MKLYLINNEICQGEDSLEEICALQPLTNEQTEFYNSNPGASVSEVINCQLIVPYVPSLEESIKFKVDAFLEKHLKIEREYYRNIRLLIVLMKYFFKQLKMHSSFF